MKTVQNRAMTSFLGVHRQAPLVGMLGDMGWLSSSSRRKIEIFQYRNRIMKLNNHRITKHIFLFDYNSNQRNTWSLYVKKLFLELDIPHTLHLSICNIDIVKSLIH